MELYEEMLIQMLEEGKVISKIKRNAAKVLEKRCYQALVEIKHILEDDRLSDPQCFMQIEEIVCVFERLGSGCGIRHDFG